MKTCHSKMLVVHGGSPLQVWAVSAKFLPDEARAKFSILQPEPHCKNWWKDLCNCSQTPASQLWFTLEVFLLGLLSGNPRDGAEIDGTLETHVWLLWSRLLNRHVGKWSQGDTRNSIMNGVARLVFLTDKQPWGLVRSMGQKLRGEKTPVPDCPLQIQPVETSGSWLDRSPTTRWQGDVCSEWHRGVVWYAECHLKTGEYIDYIMSMRNIEPLVKESESPIITYHKLPHIPFFIHFPLSCQAAKPLGAGW